MKLISIIYMKKLNEISTEIINLKNFIEKTEIINLESLIEKTEIIKLMQKNIEKKI